jgi:hypothetical protein
MEHNRFRQLLAITRQSHAEAKLPLFSSAFLISTGTTKRTPLQQTRHSLGQDDTVSWRFRFFIPSFSKLEDYEHTVEKQQYTVCKDLRLYLLACCRALPFLNSCITDASEHEAYDNNKNCHELSLIIANLSKRGQRKAIAIIKGFRVVRLFPLGSAFQSISFCFKPATPAIA